MTISDTDKIDFLWKKVIYGVTKTANSAIKSGANESIASPYAISSDNIWANANLIPAIPPVTATSDIVPYIGSQRIRATSDNTSPPYRTWLATSSYNSPITTLKTFIPPIYGPGYIAEVFIGDPNVGPAARIFPDAESEEYVFDYSAGVLNFVNNIPSSKSATIGSGSVTIQSNGIYIIAHRYVGPTGGGGGGGGIGDYVSKTGDTMSGQLIFSMTNETDGKTILFSADPTANSYAGIGTLNTGETRFFANSSSVLSLGHMSTIDGETYTSDLSIGPDGVVTIGSAADGVISAEDGYRIVLGHISTSKNLTEDFVLEANGVAYSKGYNVLTSGSNTGVLSGFASSFAPLATGTYLSANIVVDNTGRIISASDGAGGTGGGSGSVTQVNLTGSSAISVTGLPITTSGTYAIDLSNTGVAVGTYSKVSVDIKGRITAGYSLSSGDVTTALGFTPLQHNETVTLSGDITGSGTTAITTALSTTGVSAGTYTLSTIVVDAKGRITNATSGAAIGTVTSVNANSSTLSVTGGPVTSSGTLSINLSNFGAVGTYTKVVTDAYGRIASGSALSSGDVTTALGFTPGQGTVTNISASGSSDILISGSPISSSGTLGFSLSNTLVTPGTYTVSTIVVDAKGRITNAVSGALSGTGTVTSVNANSTTLSISGGPVTSSGTLSINLSTVGTAGTYAKVVTDAYGRVTASSALLSGDVTTALGFTPGQGTVTSVNANSTTLSISGGPVTSSGILSINLSTVGTAGTYAKVITDAYGRITAGSTLSSSDVTTALGFTPLQHNETITASGDVSGSGTNSISLTLADTGVTAGNYTLASITVDSKGRITSVSNGSVSGASGGTVTSVAVSGDSAISVSGSPITGSGTIALSLSNTGVVAGTYTKMVVDAQGRITANSALSSGDVTTALGFTPGQGTVTSVNANSTTLSISGGPVTSSGILSINLSTVGTAGTYAKVVTDSYGRITSGSALSTTDVTTGLGYTPLQHNETVTISGDASGSGTNAITLTLANVGTAGTYQKVVINSKGLVTSGSALLNTDITTALGYTPLQNAVTSIAASSTTLSISGGPVTSSGTLSINLSTVGTAGTYAKVVTDAYGRVTASSALLSGDVTTALGFTPGTGNGTVTSVNANSSTLSISGGPVTSSGELSINLPTLGSVGTYTKVTTDAYGRITAGSALSNTDVTTALGYTPLQHNETVTISGDITGSGTTSISAALSATGVGAGTYTLSTIVVDSKGRITSANSGVSGVTNVSTANSSNIITSGTNSITSSGTLAFDLSNTGVTPGTYNFSTIVVDAKGRISNASSNSSSGGASFGVTKANTTVVSATTTLNFTGNGVTVTDQGSGVANVNVQDRVEYAYFQYGSGGSGNFTTGDNLISNSANMVVTITDATNCVVKFTFTGYTNPPIGIAVYGQNYATNQFTYNAVNGSYASNATRVVSGGGTASSPTFMNTFTDVTLSMKMGDTGASASVGQRSHAYIVFKF